MVTYFMWLMALSAKTKSLFRDCNTIYDARSEIYREVYGYPSKSIEISQSTSVDLQDENVVILVEALTNPLCKTTKAVCYDGNLIELNKDDISFPEDVSYPGLKFLLDEKRITLIDVRNVTELKDVGKIPGSYNVPLHEIPEAFQLKPQIFEERYRFPLPDLNAKNVVLTCRSGRRTLEAQKRLKTIGYEFLRVYRGSFNDWLANKGEVQKVH